MSDRAESQICLFGGSFDPVHLGHLLVAQAAQEELNLNRLYFVPTARSPFKADNVAAGANIRLRLLRLALAGKPWCEVDDQEIRRGGTSYTIDTVSDYVERFPGAKLFYLTGTDLLKDLPKWRDAEQLAGMVEFVVIDRPGLPAVELPAPFRIRRLNGFPVSISSTEIRERVRARLAIDHLVPSRVAEEIQHNQLYFSGQ